MKKNLNIAYLNGAEGMIRRGGSSSGGSGENGNKITMEYYKINWDFVDENGFGLKDESYKDYRSIIAKAQYLNFYSNDEGVPMIACVGDYYVSEDNFDFTTVSKIAGYNIPTYMIVGEEKSMSETSSWLGSIQYYGWEFMPHYDWLIPITEEEFYLFDNNNINY